MGDGGEGACDASPAESADGDVLDTDSNAQADVAVNESSLDARLYSIDSISPLEAELISAESDGADQDRPQLESNDPSRARVLDILDASEQRKEYGHNWISPDDWFERIKAYEGKNFWDGLKGMWYLFFCLTETSAERNPIKDIDAGANKIFIPGFLGIPRSIEPFEKALGEKVAYVDTTDTKEIMRIIRYAASKQGRVEVIGFSDGGRVIQDLIKNGADEIVDRWYALATNPIKTNSSRLICIRGKNDWLAPMEEEYTTKGAIMVDGGHTFMFSDEKTMKQIASIIRQQRPSRTYYMSQTGYGPLYEMKKAA